MSELEKKKIGGHTVKKGFHEKTTAKRGSPESKKKVWIKMLRAVAQVDFYLWGN